jgi:molybdopterin molybdotransferase
MGEKWDMSEPTVEYLTVAEALAKVLAAVQPLPAELVPLPQALHRVLAQAVVAQDDLPPFANSAMDGYAVQAQDTAVSSPTNPATLQVIGEVPAGTVFAGTVTAGTAVRIMTGAPLPNGADAIIPVEDTTEAWREANRPLPSQIGVLRAVQVGDYVRWPGEDIKRDTAVLQPGHFLRPAEIGLLASLGVAQVAVIRQPRVGILATGDELIPVSAPLQPGKIRNSNEYAQVAQVQALGAIPVSLGVAQDREEDVRAKLQAGLAQGVDLFVSSAGVSVGVYDVVTAVLQQSGGINFWRVRMRPGKPLAFGHYHGVPYLGLPGNPVSAMVSFARFARSAILKMAGFTQLDHPQLIATLTDSLDSDGRESYIRVIIEMTPNGYTATPTGGQGSHLITSLVKANALLVIPEGVTHVPAGSRLPALMLDWPHTMQPFPT